MLVIKIGGSIIQTSDYDINPQFLRFVEVLKIYPDKVSLVNGGGPLCRLLQNYLRSYSGVSGDDLDRMGIKVNNMYGEFIKMLFPKDQTYPKLMISKNQMIKAREKMDSYKYFIGGAKDVGHSSDYDAVLVADVFRVDRVLRITNVDYIYDKDPKIHPDATKIERISWKEYLSMFKESFKPGGSYPFDPIASRLAMRKGIRVYLTSIGRLLSSKAINFEHFEGSIIG